MSEKKINVDLNLFKVTNKTRKKRNTENNDDGAIKIKTPSEKKRNDTLKKRSILKMIRQHQEERYKKLFDKDEKKPVLGGNSSVENNDPTFNKDFDEAQKYLQTLTDKKKQSLNHTVRNYSSNVPNSLLLHPSIDALKPDSVPLNNFIPSSSNVMNLSTSLQNVAPPKYGCLKNGVLPTYRTMMNQTRKEYHTPELSLSPNTPLNINPISPIIVGGNNSVNPIQQIQQVKENIAKNNDNKIDVISAETNKILERKLNESLGRVNEMKETEMKLQQLKRELKPKKMKRRRTIRRTYRIGKSKVAPKVAVLVSNKTIRNGILTKSQLLKQTPIEEVKRHLINRGMIKVGSITPNDVLRKMYESSIMICGDVYNHNPDNLLYNFMNDK